MSPGWRRSACTVYIASSLYICCTVLYTCTPDPYNIQCTICAVQHCSPVHLVPTKYSVHLRCTVLYTCTPWFLQCTVFICAVQYCTPGHRGSSYVQFTSLMYSTVHRGSSNVQFTPILYSTVHLYTWTLQCAVYICAVQYFTPVHSGSFNVQCTSVLTVVFQKPTDKMLVLNPCYSPD